ncbi:hypothetical protein GCM10027515_21990 [Schumannella luteola]|uniref:Uncharacterized protein n=1 Tax=Schumannella luteola TaxID=472059 RepID=A0A852YRX4_9MICO|nr:hypothetical protein [Schumannella luteola]NYH00006.1 hypothetical protein [Schumannella luteola]TPX05455.1 hypothetical protein FJ656_06070 [Schumannella luteola]
MAVNAVLPPPVAAGLPDVLTATVERVSGWGGDPARYAASAAAGLAALRAIGGEPSGGGAAAADSAAAQAEPVALRAIGTVAAWRSGIPAFRRASRDAAAALPREVAGATLGLEAQQVTELLAAGDDPLVWPGAGSELALVGGFRGLGGVWTLPPSDLVVAEGTLLAVATGEQWWHVELDAVGCRITPAAEPLTQASPDRARLVAEISTDSYLVSVGRRG